MPIGLIAGATAVAGVAGSVISSSNNRKAINKSTDASLQANRDALAAQERAFNQILPLQQSALNATVANNGAAYNAGGQAMTDAYNNSTSALTPWMKTGYNANDALNDITGLPRTGGYTPPRATFTPMAVTSPVPVAPALAAPVKTTPTPVFNPTSYANINDLMTDPAYRALTTAGRRDARLDFLGGQ